MEFFTALSVLAAICVSGGVGFYLNKHLNAKRIGDATELATRIVEESRKEAQAQKKEILLQGQDELFNQKRELEHEFKERERELKARDRKLQEEILRTPLEKFGDQEVEELAKKYAEDAPAAVAVAPETSGDQQVEDLAEKHEENISDRKTGD